MALRGKVSERLVAHLWRLQALKKEELITSGGRRLQVVFPGRENEDSGPDFRDATIATEEGRLWRGDIEVHVRSGDWQAHGHHRDPCYNGVILHVVMWQSGESVSYRQDGEAIPVISLNSYLKKPIEELVQETQLPLTSAEPCSQAVKHLGTAAVATLLDKAGEERFYSRSKYFAAELGHKDRGQVLYEGIMEALGYARNKQSFRTLAQKLPLSMIEELSYNETFSQCTLMLQALLLGAAGLLPQQRSQETMQGEKWVNKMERLWLSWEREPLMRESDWYLFRVRPENFPARRLAAASILLARYRKDGLLDNMLRLINQSLPPHGHKKVEQALEVATSGYWAEHFDCGMTTKRRTPHLIGQNRAGEIAVNILLPFFFAWSEVASEPWLGERVVKLYRSYPVLGDNRLTRQMKRQMSEDNNHRLVNSAQRQQGLIHLYKTFCLERRCPHCPLGYPMSQ